MTETPDGNNKSWATSIIPDAEQFGEHLQPTLSPEDKQAQKKFVTMLNAPATNELTTISTIKTPPTVDPITGIATLTQGNLKVFIDSYEELASDFKISTVKLLDACTIQLTRQNHYKDSGTLNTLITIPLADYARQCGVNISTKSRLDNFRRKVNEDLETLYHISIKWTEKSRKKLKDYDEMRLCVRKGVRDGNIIFEFHRGLAEYLNNAYIMQYAPALLKTNERKPYIYQIGRKLLLHNSIDNNKLRGTANIISVKALLESATDIPSYENVMRTNRNITDRIIQPFEDALDALQHEYGLISWEYCNSKGTPLTDEQASIADYNTFITLYIRFEVIGAPDQTARLQARAEEAKAKAAKKKRTTKKKTTETEPPAE